MQVTIPSILGNPNKDKMLMAINTYEATQPQASTLGLHKPETASDDEEDTFSTPSTSKKVKLAPGATSSSSGDYLVLEGQLRREQAQLKLDQAQLKKDQAQLKKDQAKLAKDQENFAKELAKHKESVVALKHDKAVFGQQMREEQERQVLATPKKKTAGTLADQEAVKAHKASAATAAAAKPKPTKVTKVTKSTASAKDKEGGDGDDFWIETILKHKIVDGEWRFFVHWWGYPDSADTWKSLEDIGIGEVLDKYLQELGMIVVTKAGKLQIVPAASSSSSSTATASAPVPIDDEEVQCADSVTPTADGDAPAAPKQQEAADAQEHSTDKDGDAAPAK